MFKQLKTNIYLLGIIFYHVLYALLIIIKNKLYSLLIFKHEKIWTRAACGVYVLGIRKLIDHEKTCTDCTNSMGDLRAILDETQKRR